MKRCNHRGYSLVELMVSATIIALLAIAVVSMVRKSNHLRSEDAHRRRARAIIDSCFESRSYHYSNYVDLSGDTLSVIIDERESTVRKMTTGELSLLQSQMKRKCPDLTESLSPIKK